MKFNKSFFLLLSISFLVFSLMLASSYHRQLDSDNTFSIKSHTYYHQYDSGGETVFYKQLVNYNYQDDRYYFPSMRYDQIYQTDYYGYGVNPSNPYANDHYSKPVSDWHSAMYNWRYSSPNI